MSILELLKNIFNIKDCVFVLAIDYQVVVKGLKEKFGEPTPENEWEFRAFFDKIIQLPFSMPMGDYDIANYVLGLLDEIDFYKGEEELDPELINQFGDLDSLLAGAVTIKQPKRRENLINFAEQARISRQLVYLKDDVDLPVDIHGLATPEADDDKLIAFLAEQGFKSLILSLIHI